MRNGDYEGVEQMESDLNVMFDNAKRYNVPKSAIYKRAHKLQQIMQVNIFLIFQLDAITFFDIKHKLVLQVDYGCRTYDLPDEGSNLAHLMNSVMLMMCVFIISKLKMCYYSE